MSILTHGSDLSLSPTVGPLVRTTGMPLRHAIQQLAHAGFQSLHLDATLPGLRPRELDRTARKDLAALLRRQGAGLSGLDLFIPRHHWQQHQHVDRALHAALAAIDLARQLGPVPLCLPLPVHEIDASLQTTLVEAADATDVRLAIHAEDQLDALEQWVNDVALPALGIALDPAALLMHQHDAAGIAQRFSNHLAVARLADLKQNPETTRCAPGQGRLDLLTYRVAVDLAKHRPGPVVLDLQSLQNPLHDAQNARQHWENAAFSI